MINVTYSVSLKLKENISKIATLRQQILLAIIPPKFEANQKFNTTVGRIHSSLALSDIKYPAEKIAKLLMTQGLGLSYSKRTMYGSKSEEQLVLDYKNGLDFIKHNWFVNPDSISPKTIINLHSASCPGRLRSENAIKQIIDYLDSSPNENPIIMSGIALIEMANATPFTDGNGRIARLTSYLYLYKYGLDFRGLLNIEEFLFNNLGEYKEYKQQILKNKNLTHWLEFYTGGIVEQLTKSLSSLSSISPKDLTSDKGQFTDRQRAILTYLEVPASSITNKRVQEIFKVSQITASRDLAQLTALGMIFPQGKGRSIRYRKAP